jgi:hypothetical protein
MRRYRRHLWIMLYLALVVMVGLPTAAHPLRAAQRAQTSGIEGTYIALRPAASSALQTISLTLSEDGSAEMTTDFHNDEEPIIEIGTWEENGDGTILLTLTGRADESYEEPTEVTFQVEDGILASVDAEERYGSEGLQLRLARDVAADLNKSLITLDLEAGFALDPTFVSVQGGGEVDVSLLDPACRGFVHAQPVVTVNWSGEAEMVRAFFVSDSDPTLVVMTPDGEIHCDDDANPLVLDPSVEIDAPSEGTYRIWVGSVQPNQLIPGVLVMTTQPDVSLATFDLDGLIQRPPLAEAVDPARAANLEAIAAAIEEMVTDAPELSAEAEPLTVLVTAEGTVPLPQLQLDNPLCNGLVAPTPDFVFHWSGQADQLTVYYEGDLDATLLVYGAADGPAGGVAWCNDDAEIVANVNPSISIAQPQEGVYGVWVGRIDPTQAVTGTLTVTSAPDAQPATLAPAPTE